MATTANHVAGSMAAGPVETARQKERTAEVSLQAHQDAVRRTSTILKAIAHESRLIILCALLQGEKAVSELEAILELRQPAVSQQLARLRGDRLVNTHRVGKMIYYSLSDDPQVREIVAFLCKMLKQDSGAQGI